VRPALKVVMLKDGEFSDVILPYLPSGGWKMDPMDTAGARHGVSSTQELPGK
jgi:hypothetical protein